MKRFDRILIKQIKPLNNDTHILIHATSMGAKPEL